MLVTNPRRINHEQLRILLEMPKAVSITSICIGRQEPTTRF